VSKSGDGKEANGQNQIYACSACNGPKGKWDKGLYTFFKLSRPGEKKFYSQAMLKIGRFMGETLIVDDRRIDGTFFDHVEGPMGYFREKLDTRFEMTGQPQREVYVGL